MRVGDIVKEDAPLVDVMTDKATVEMTSPVSGKVISIHGEPGDMAPVGAAIAVFETEAEADLGPQQDRGSSDPQNRSKDTALTTSAPASAPKPNGPAPPASEPKPRIKAPAGAVWSEEATQAAIQGAAPCCWAPPRHCANGSGCAFGSWKTR